MVFATAATVAPIAAAVTAVAVLAIVCAVAPPTRAAVFANVCAAVMGATRAAMVTSGPQAGFPVATFKTGEVSSHGLPPAGFRV